MENIRKENIVDLTSYRDKQHENKLPISEELRIAIHHLIYRMRELGPISNSG